MTLRSDSLKERPCLLCCHTHQIKFCR